MSRLVLNALIQLNLKPSTTHSSTQSQMFMDIKMINVFNSTKYDLNEPSFDVFLSSLNHIVAICVSYLS